LKKTTKGYSPKDILNYWGPIKIAINYLKKRIVRKVMPIKSNNLKILSGFEKNKSNFAVDCPNPLFSVNSLKNIFIRELAVSDRDSYVRSLSMINFLGNRRDEHD